MGFSVGIPCMKCSLHPSQQVSSRTGKSAKTCGISSAWKEMNDLRAGRDTTIDRTMTDKNVWMTGSTGDDVAGIVQDEINHINQLRHDTGKRALREDAVSVVEIVEKPPISFMQNLSYEERVKFLNDSHRVMTELIHDWNDQWQIIEAVQHHDEFGGMSAHNHTLVMLTSIDKDGIPTMQAKTEMNLKFFNHINSHYSQCMQALGYDVNECKTYDRLSEDEKEERKLHPQEHGIDAYAYKQKKMKEDAEKLQKMEEKHAELSDKVKQTEKKAAAYETKIVELTKAPDYQSYEAVKQESAYLKKELQMKDKIIEKLKGEVLNLQKIAEEWKGRFYLLAKQVGQTILTRLGFSIGTEMVQNVLPSRKLLEDMEKEINLLRGIDSESLKIIPDNSNRNKYKIISYKDNVENEVIKSGFSSREEAEEYRIELKHISLQTSYKKKEKLTH